MKKNWRASKTSSLVYNMGDYRIVVIGELGGLGLFNLLFDDIFLSVYSSFCRSSIYTSSRGVVDYSLASRDS